MTRHDPALSPTARLRANVALPFGQAIAMPKPVCTSAGFAALDQRHIFARDRLCAGRADVLRAPGGHLTMEIPGKPILVTRDRGGHVPAMSKVCRHRVSTLPEGRGTTRTTVCPRHGSTYNLLQGPDRPAPGALQGLAGPDHGHADPRCAPCRQPSCQRFGPDRPLSDGS